MPSHPHLAVAAVANETLRLGRQVVVKSGLGLVLRVGRPQPLEPAGHAGTTG